MKLLILQFAACSAIWGVGSWLIGGGGVHFPSYLVGVLALAAVRHVRDVVEAS